MSTVFEASYTKLKKLEARNEKLQARLDAAFPKERRHDVYGEIRTLARAPEGYRIVRRTGCAVAQFVMSDVEWDSLSTTPLKDKKQPKQTRSSGRNEAYYLANAINKSAGSAEKA